MKLKQIIAAVDIAIEESGATGVNRLRPGVAAHIYRDVWMEHQAFPDMPLEWILVRHIGEGVCTQELNWWHDQGGKLLG
jgi:hypothetical protein